MPRYIRAFVPGGTFLFTVALLERKRCLLTARIDLQRNCFAEVRRARPFQVDAIAVMADHLHCIWTLPPDDADCSSRWPAIKAGFSRGIEPGERLSDSRCRKGERGIRQRRFWEHTTRDEHDFERHVDYIHFNPVQHGHVLGAADWPFSSFHRSVRHGLYPVDWGAAGDILAMDLE